MDQPPGFVVQGSLVWSVSCVDLFMVSSNLAVLGLESLAMIVNPLG